MIRFRELIEVSKRQKRNLRGKRRFFKKVKIKDGFWKDLILNLN